MPHVDHGSRAIGAHHVREAVVDAREPLGHEEVEPI
jgi:hypothetical protein